MAIPQIGTPIEEVVGTYQSGSGVVLTNIRYDTRQDIGGTRSGRFQFFIKQKGTSDGSTFADTNMSAGGMIENGRAFEVQKIAVRVLNRSALEAAVSATGDWYHNVIRTLFLYGILSFRVSGTDHLGEFPLAHLLPTIAQQGGEHASVSGVSVAPAVIDLGKNVIPLSSMVNFGLDLSIEIPQTEWKLDTTSLKGSWAPVGATDPKGFVPEGTVVKVELIGKEVFSQL